MNQQQHQHSSCHICFKPFGIANGRIPKLLRCSHTTCVKCLNDTCLTDDKKAVICLKCTKKTYLEPIVPKNIQLLFNNDNTNSSNNSTPPLLTCENGLITNYRFLMEHHSSASRKKLLTSDEDDSSQASAMSFLVDCEAPNCHEKATGRCDGCGGAAFCQRCYNNHLTCLPQLVREKHSFGSVADSQSCPKHKLPRQLFCMSHHKAICATCASLHHRECPDIRELSTVVETLRPQIAERQEKMLDLFKIALTSCYELRNEARDIDLETERTVSNLLEKALQCVQDTYETIHQVQTAAMQRKLELDHALRCLSVEAGSFAEEVEEIKNLFEQSAKPDPALVARHAPAENPQIHTRIPTGKTVEADLVFEVKRDLKQYWERRGAAKIPSMFLLSKEQEDRERLKQQSKDFLKSLYEERGNRLSSSSSISTSTSTFYSPPPPGSSNPNAPTNVVVHTKTLSSKILTKFGKSQGTDEKSFNHIRGFTTLPNGNIAVCDQNNHRIQIVDPAAQPVREKRYQTSTSSAANNDNVLPGKFVCFIPLSSSTDPAQNQLHPACPALVCTLRNGLLFVLDNENRCGYFVDAMVDMQQRKSSTGGSIFKNKDDLLFLWRYPSSWVKPTGICLLPRTNEVAIIDEPRHVVSVLDPTLKHVVREFDGVDAVFFSITDSTSKRVTHQVGGEHSVCNDGVHQDMIHRIDAPKAICVIPNKCPWGEDLVSLIESKDEDILEFLTLSSSNNSPSNPQRGGAGPSPSSSFSISARDKNLANAEEIRHAWKKRDEQEGRQVHAQIVGEFNETKYTYTYNEKKYHTLIAVCSETFVSILDAESGAFVRFIGGDASKQRVISRPWGVCCSEDGRRLAIVDGVQSCLFVARVNNGDVIAKIVHNQGDNNNSQQQQQNEVNTNLRSPSSNNNSNNNNNNNNNILLRSVSESSQQRNRAYNLEQKQQLVLKANTFYPQNILTIPLDGRLAVTDIVSHSVNVMDVVL